MAFSEADVRFVEFAQGFGLVWLTLCRICRSFGLALLTMALSGATVLLNLQTFWISLGALGTAFETQTAFG